MARYRAVPEGGGWYVIEKKGLFGWYWYKSSMLRANEIKEFLEVININYITGKEIKIEYVNKPKSATKEL